MAHNISKSIDPVKHLPRVRTALHFVHQHVALSAAVCSPLTLLLLASSILVSTRSALGSIASAGLQKSVWCYRSCCRQQQLASRTLARRRHVQQWPRVLPEPPSAFFFSFSPILKTASTTDCVVYRLGKHLPLSSRQCQVQHLLFASKKLKTCCFFFSFDSPFSSFVFSLS